MGRKGQNVTEYALILGVMALALAAMQPFMKRGVQSTIKLTADEIGKCATVEYENYTGRNITAQLLGQSQENLYYHNITTPMKSVAVQQMDASFGKAGDGRVYNDSNRFSGAWKMRYRLFTDEIAAKPGETVTNNPDQAKPRSEK